MSDVPNLETLKQEAEMRREVVKRGCGAQSGVGFNGLGLRVKETGEGEGDEG